MGRRHGMTAGEVLATARALVAGDNGPLAMDESNPTCDKRFARAGISQTGRSPARLSGADRNHG
jgi:fructose-bisphosphate aldolase class 1